MRVKIENITPETAKIYLSKNIINRNVNAKRVSSYANDMQHGAWQLNGEAIRFNKKGELIDGQHRLLAIVKANIPVDMVVMNDIDNDVSIYDRGRNRSVTDSLILEGMDKSIASNKWVAAAKLHYLIQKSLYNVSDYDVKLFLEKNVNEIKELNSYIYKKGGHSKSARVSSTSAPAILAMFYAYKCGETLNNLKRFSEVYSTGFYDSNLETAAVVLRNDTLSGTCEVKTGSTGRRNACFKFEKAIYDFCNHYPRKISYGGWDKPVYSNNIIFKEDNK